MSIATERGDDGTTSLVGGRRVSKADVRVELCGCLDELVSQMGFARSICDHVEARALLEDLQQQLFLVSEEAATGWGESSPSLVTDAHVGALTRHVHRFEALPAVIDDWVLPGAHPAAAAIDVARTICRRAERSCVRLREHGEMLGTHTVPFVNRLSDLLWLLGRIVEQAAGVDGRLREASQGEPRWSRAWRGIPSS